jgi:RNA polymerase sigma factor (sigma-70 family)
MTVQELIVAEARQDFLNISASKLTNNDKESSQDLVQDTLYLALKNSQKYVQHTNIRGWLFTIMRNCFINKYRFEQRRKDIGQKIKEEEAGSIMLYTNENRASGYITMKEIYMCIRELPKVFSTPLLLRLEGYKYKEIAHVLEESQGTIKSRIHFARKMLKEKLEYII